MEKKTNLDLKTLDNEENSVVITLLVENRETEIRSLEWRILILAEQKEILRLEVPVNDSHGMTRMHDLNDRPQQRCCSPLRVMSLCNNTIKKLPSSAQLHDQMNRVLVFISALELHDVRLPRQVVHDLNLPPVII